MLNNKTLSDLEGGVGPLYYNFDFLMFSSPETFKKLVDIYREIEVNKKGLSEIDEIDTTGELKSYLLKRYLDISENKDVAIGNIYRIFESGEGEGLNEKTNKPTIEMINKYIKQEKKNFIRYFLNPQYPNPAPEEECNEPTHIKDSLTSCLFLPQLIDNFTVPIRCIKNNYKRGNYYGKYFI